MKTWPFTSTEMFQFPRTGLSAISRLPAQTPLVVNSLFQFLTRFPAPSVIMTSMPPVTEGFSWGDKTTVRNWTVLPGLYTALSVWMKTEYPLFLYFRLVDSRKEMGVRPFASNL